MNLPPIPYPDEIRVHPGPALLAGIERGPSLSAHREQYGDLPRVDVDALLELVSGVGLRAAAAARPSRSAPSSRPCARAPG